jgi:hypothetical protein
MHIADTVLLVGLLSRRRHIDLQRVAGALCPGSDI